MHNIMVMVSPQIIPSFFRTMTGTKYEDATPFRHPRTHAKRHVRDGVGYQYFLICSPRQRVPQGHISTAFNNF